MWKPLLMLAALSGTTAAQASDFTAWEGTRWLLEIEEALPVPLELSAQQNLTFRTKGIKVRAVVACNSVDLQGKKSASIGCEIEDIAYQAVPRHLEDDVQKVWENSQAVLDDMVRRTQGQTLEFVLNHKGRLIRVDVPGIEANNEYERQSRETLRRLATDLAAGWDLKHGAWEGKWTDTESWLMRVPTRPPSLASSQIVHSAHNVDGEIVVQTIATGALTTTFEPSELTQGDKLVRTTTKDTSTGGGVASAGRSGTTGGTKLGGAMTNASNGLSGTIPTERTYTANLTSVAIIDADLNAPRERVWALMGAPTASSVGNNAGVNVWYNGRIRMLDGDEQVDLGPTQLISPLSQPVEGLPEWVPLQDQ